MSDFIAGFNMNGIPKETRIGAELRKNLADIRNHFTLAY